MNLNELVPAPNAEKVNKLTKRVFGYALDLNNLNENKAKRLHKNLTGQMKLYESKLGSESQKRTKYYEMKLALEALTKHIAERAVEEDDVEEGNKFSGERDKAIAAGENEFEVDGKKYKVTEESKITEAKFDVDADKINNEDLTTMNDIMGSYASEHGEGTVDFSAMNEDDVTTISEIISDYVVEASAEGENYSYEVVIENGSYNISLEIEQPVNNESIIKEGAVESSELIMAAKSMVDKYDAMIKDLGEMINEDLAPVADKVRDEMGSEIADSFSSQMTQALQNTLDVMKQDRAIADGATRVLVGDAPIDPLGADTDVIPDETMMEPTVDQDDDFAAADAAQGGEEAPVGREKRA